MLIRPTNGPLYVKLQYATGSSSRPYLVAALILCLTLLQSSISSGFEVFGVIPDLVLVFLASWAVVARPKGLIFWGFGSGFLVDIFSGVPAGTNMLGLSVATFVASMGGAGLFRTNLVWALLAALLGTLIYYPVIMLVLAIHGFTIDWLTAITATTPAAIMVNLMACVFIYRPVVILENITRGRRPYTMH